jgi:hypothetical protein
MLKKAVHQGSGCMARCGVDDQARRFVHHDQRGILIDNAELYRLGF